MCESPQDMGDFNETKGCLGDALMASFPTTESPRSLHAEELDDDDDDDRGAGWAPSKGFQGWAFSSGLPGSRLMEAINVCMAHPAQPDISPLPPKLQLRASLGHYQYYAFHG
jgi:hypothetical protein